MSVAGLILAAIPAAAALGTGMWKLGSGLFAMSAAVRSLVKLGEDHEKRILALEHPAGGGS